MDNDAIKFLESLPVPFPVIVSRVCVGAGFFSLLIGAYVIQARDRVERANRELRHLIAVHDAPDPVTPTIPIVFRRRLSLVKSPTRERPMAA